MFVAWIPYFVYMRSEGSGGTARRLRLVWAVACVHAHLFSGLEVEGFVWHILYFQTLWMRETKALVGLLEWLGWHEPSLLANTISNRISCAGQLMFVAWIPYFVSYGTISAVIGFICPIISLEYWPHSQLTCWNLWHQLHRKVYKGFQ